MGVGYTPSPLKERSGKRHCSLSSILKINLWVSNCIFWCILRAIISATDCLIKINSTGQRGTSGVVGHVPLGSLNPPINVGLPFTHVISVFGHKQVCTHGLVSFGSPITTTSGSIPRGYGPPLIAVNWYSFRTYSSRSSYNKGRVYYRSTTSGIEVRTTSTIAVKTGFTLVFISTSEIDLILLLFLSSFGRLLQKAQRSVVFLG